MCSFKVYFDSKIEIIDDLSHISLPHLFSASIFGKGTLEWYV